MIRSFSLQQVKQFFDEHNVLPLSRLEHSNACFSDTEFSRVSTDTRTIEAGDLFIALRGENFDGHNFLNQAVGKKCVGLVVEDFYPNIPLPQLIVKDCTKALGQIAALNRSYFTGPLVAITGSNGKTTVKTMLAAILSECGTTHATRGNLNNHIGVPLTLLDLNPDHQFAVIEMGANHINEIAYSCSLATPTIAMINNVMAAHIEGFGSLAGVSRAKSEIYDGLQKDGTAIVNIDDVYSPDWLAKLKEHKVIQVSLGNKNAKADCFAQNIIFTDDKLNFLLNLDGKSTAITLNAEGEHNVRNALMAAACAYAAGASLLQIQQGLKNFAPVSGRLKQFIGIKGALVIDDSYNANPGSVRAAIDVLATKSSQTVLVLGDLGELGPDAAREHADLGSYAKDKKIKHLCTVGKLTQETTNAFGEGATHFPDQASLIAHLKTIATADTRFLIKGSRSSAMDLVVKALVDSIKSNSINNAVSAGDLH